jgi:hypothetical protein
VASREGSFRNVTGFVARGLGAGAVAAVLSGAPSTTVALVTGRDPLEAIRAAGSLVGSPNLRAGLVVHAAVSLGWGVVLAAALPRRRPALWGAAGGGVIALLDLGLVGRRYPRIRALPIVPQVADHVVYGAMVGIVLALTHS